MIATVYGGCTLLAYGSATAAAYVRMIMNGAFSGDIASQNWKAFLCRGVRFWSSECRWGTGDYRRWVLDQGDLRRPTFDGSPDYATT